MARPDRPSRRKPAPVTRLAVLALVLVALAGGLLALAPLLISTDLAQRRLAEQITLWTGRPVTFTGKPTVALHPQLTITLPGVVIGDVNDPTQPFISMDALRGSVRLLPLLVGRVEVNEFELIRPRIELRVDRDGRANWAELGGTLGDRIAAAGLDDAGREAPEALRLGRFVVTEGEVNYRNAASGLRTAFRNVSIDASWPTTSRAAAVSSRFTWNGEEVEAYGSVADPLRLFGGQTTAASLTLASQPVHLTFAGEVHRAGSYQFRGEFAITTPSVRRLVSWTGTPMHPNASLGAGSANGQASFRAGTLSFSDVRLSLDGNTGTGVLSASLFGERPQIQGTLAFDRLDLSTYLDTIASGVRTAPRWTAAPIRLPVLDGVDTDIRLSAQTVVLGRLRLTEAAVSAAIRDGRLSINLGNASLFGARLQAALSADIRPGGVAGSFRASLRRLPLEEALAGLFGIEDIAGTAGLAVEAAGAGETLGELVASLKGTVTVRFADLSFQRLDLAGALAPDRSFPASLFHLGGGSTDFTTAEAGLRFDRGQLRVERLSAADRRSKVTGIGWASLFQPGISLAGSLITETSAGGRSVPFLIHGTWGRLNIEADPNREVVTLAPRPFPLPVPEAVAVPAPAWE